MGAKEVSCRISIVKKEKIKLFSIKVVFLLTKGLLMGDPSELSGKGVSKIALY